MGLLNRSMRSYVRQAARRRVLPSHKIMPARPAGDGVTVSPPTRYGFGWLKMFRRWF